MNCHGSTFNKLRIKQLRTLILKNKIDGLLVTSPANLRYLFGIGEEGCIGWVSPYDIALFVPDMYRTYIFDNFCPARIIHRKKYFSVYVRKRKISRIGFESAYITCNNLENIIKILGKRKKFVPQKNLVETIRMVKEQSELDAIKTAVKITQNVYRDIKRKIKPGSTEKEIVIEIGRLMRNKGSERIAFDTIVASGTNSIYPHHLSGLRYIRNSEFIVIDMGCRYNGYCSDLTRTFFLGKINTQQRRIYTLVEEAQMSALEKIRPGERCSAVDRAARRVFQKAGMGKFFVHNTGHGVGMEVHEAPYLSPESSDIIQEGMVLTVEPGLYIPGSGGVRIEDMVLVTKGGCEILS